MEIDDYLIKPISFGEYVEVARKLAQKANT